MASIGKIARRTFLIGSAAVAGGVAFGTWVVRKPHANPLEDGLPEGAATFNPWVRIDSDRIMLITPHADLGQGVAQMQATLIAEELDLEPGQFETDFGTPSPAYFNGAFANDAAEDLARIAPLSAAALHGIIFSAIKVLGVQGTGGSTSVADSFDKLRQAGAVARETLKAAAALETGQPVADLRTRAGHVLLRDGTEIPYQALAARAAGIEPVTRVSLRHRSEWRLIGQPVERLDIPAKSTGTQAYGIDLSVPGMVHAAVRMSPRRGPLSSYDASAAEAMRGVSQVLEVTNGIAVVADNTWRAIRAANAIETDWAPANYPADQDGHWAALSESFVPDRLDAEWRNDGDVDAAGGEVIEAEYRAPYVAHQPLEPLNAIVRVDPAGSEVWTGHQIPGFVRNVVASVTGEDASGITLHNQYSGGSFGHRLEFEHIRQAAEIAAQMPGTPVKLTYSREEDFAQDFPRHIAIGRGRGTVADGQVVSVDISAAAPPVVASQMGRIGLSASGPDSQIGAGIFNAPYDIPNFRFRGYAVPGLAPVSSWRSVGASWGGFFIESLMDELIRGAGADPVVERLRLMEAYPVAAGVLRRCAEMADWGAGRAENQGRGVAIVESFGTPVAEIVDVTMTERGIRIDDVWVVADPGIVVDPVNIENHIQGAVVWGLGHAMNSEITYADGMAQQANYNDAEGMRMHQAPRIHVAWNEDNDSPRGIGEPPVPPAAPALANAIFDATGQRLREMPFRNFIDFI
ncbi:molybdopterin-dependent oxidoreductase [Rhodobacterales bacterium HKCCE3408]|nr:molybdopterin-dependent oxidoreductase [Rhodobacterales bacterium HKCCE3408]